ncbi:MAG: class I tRNA ligase family protein [Verrucomicrobiota bacterium]
MILQLSIKRVEEARSKHGERHLTTFPNAISRNVSQGSSKDSHDIITHLGIAHFHDVGEVFYENGYLWFEPELLRILRTDVPCEELDRLVLHPTTILFQGLEESSVAVCRQTKPSTTLFRSFLLSAETSYLDFEQVAMFQLLFQLHRQGDLHTTRIFPNLPDEIPTIIHSYPHCWRCDTALIYRSVSTWFVNVEQIKDKLLEANKETRWTPQHIRDGRFGNWLEGARDWAISRNRFWGTPLPIWESPDGKEHRVFGSIKEVENASGSKLEDLHKHVVDKIVIKGDNGQEFRRVPQVLDCWFESGAMPYAQAHYPFENKDRFEQNFPADFIAEGLDQTRGWFYTLMVLSTALFGKPAFTNVVVNGLILAEDGRKMSKRLKNYPDPMYIIETYGADALRLYMISSPVVRAEDLRFSESGVRDVLRHIIIPLWNAYSFFVTYANIDEWSPDKATGLDRKTGILDRWILSSLQSLSEKVANAMDSYDLQKAVRPFLSFIDDLTNWYIRRSRRRFWKSRDDGDKSEAYETLWHILLEVSRIAAPFIPFISESIYMNLKGRSMPESVHLCDFPEPDESLRDSELESQMSLVMLVVKLGRLLRSEHNIKVRQPLARMHIVSRNEIIRRQVNELKNIALNELNVKSVEVESDETRLVRLKARPNFKLLGPKWGRQVGKIAGAIELLGDQDAEQLADGKSVELFIDGEKVELKPNEALIERIPREGLIVASEGEVAVALETTQTEELVKEGHAREIVNRIQNLRKQKDLEVSQRIKYMYCAPPEIEHVMENFGGYIAAETLTVEMKSQDKAAVTADWEEVDINGHTCWHMLEPAN